MALTQIRGIVERIHIAYAKRFACFNGCVFFEPISETGNPGWGKPAAVTGGGKDRRFGFIALESLCAPIDDFFPIGQMIGIIFWIGRIADSSEMIPVAHVGLNNRLSIQVHHIRIEGLRGEMMNGFVHTGRPGTAKQHAHRLHLFDTLPVSLVKIDIRPLQAGDMKIPDRLKNIHLRSGRHFPEFQRAHDDIVCARPDRLRMEHSRHHTAKYHDSTTMRPSQIHTPYLSSSRFFRHFSFDFHDFDILILLFLLWASLYP